MITHLAVQSSRQTLFILPAMIAHSAVQLSTATQNTMLFVYRHLNNQTHYLIRTPSLAIIASNEEIRSFFFCHLTHYQRRRKSPDCARKFNANLTTSLYQFDTRETNFAL